MDGNSPGRSGNDAAEYSRANRKDGGMADERIGDDRAGVGGSGGEFAASVGGAIRVPGGVDDRTGAAIQYIRAGFFDRVGRDEAAATLADDPPAVDSAARRAAGEAGQALPLHARAIVA